MFLKISIILSILLIFILIIIGRKKEPWCNGFSGWPGPLEDGSGRYNIPALYGNPKYESPCHYEYGLNPNSNYISMKGYPQG